jgi:endopolyphosphatase
VFRLIQYYLPGLESADKRTPPKWELEYLTLPPALLHPPSSDEADGFYYPFPLRNLPRSMRNATITASKYAPYHLTDLTIGSWVGLAQRLANTREKRLRKKFRRYITLGDPEEDE